MNTNLSYEDNILKHTISDELLSGNEVGVVGIIEQKSPSRQTLMSIGYVIAKENGVEIYNRLRRSFDSCQDIFISVLKELQYTYASSVVEPLEYKPLYTALQVGFLIGFQEVQKSTVREEKHSKDSQTKKKNVSIKSKKTTKKSSTKRSSRV